MDGSKEGKTEESLGKGRGGGAEGRKREKGQGKKMKCANATLNKCTNVFTCFCETETELSCLYHFCSSQTAGLRFTVGRRHL